ncbi:MAG TPA: hypothetical protein VF077_07615 [Nitrospiraceae bacterium]
MQPSAPPPPGGPPPPASTPPGAPGGATPPPFGPAALAGQPEAPVVADPAEMQRQTLQSAVQQVRRIEDAILALADQFPVAARDARNAQEAIRSMLKRIVSTPTGEVEPAGPRVLG